MTPISVNNIYTVSRNGYHTCKLNSKVSVPPLTTPSGAVTSDPIVKAQLINEYRSFIF